MSVEVERVAVTDRFGKVAVFWEQESWSGVGGVDVKPDILPSADSLNVCDWINGG
jgi:hypothetical protein